MVEIPGPPEDHDRPGRWLIGAAALAVACGVVLRFVTSSPLWLDESLSVNIARLPIGDIPGALKQDGHPPLYYFILHWWMELFGSSDSAVRALAGVWSVLLLPMVWLATRRLAGVRAATLALILTALSPFAVRYGTETRMYSMVSVLALAGYLSGRAAMERTTPLRLAGVVVTTGLLLWTHYWSMWFLAVAGILLLASSANRFRKGRSAEARAPLAVIGALVVGGLTFLPWLGHLLYQSEHTGTPWARPMRPAEILATMVADFGGGISGESVVLGWAIAVLAVAGVIARSGGPYRLVVDLRAPGATRIPAALVVGTLAVACLAGYATGATFASRYAAVIHPLVVVLAGIGVSVLRPRWLGAALLSSLLLLSGVGLYRNVTLDRSDARRSADAIAAAAVPGDLVVYCPDQLGPSTSRLVRSDLEQVTYPEFAGPDRVNWVDYKARIDATDPERFGAELLERAAGRNVFLVYSTAYDTHSSICPDLFNVLGRQRVPEVLTHASEAFEPAGVALFPGG